MSSVLVALISATTAVQAACPATDPCLNGGSCTADNLPVGAVSGYCCQCAAGFQQVNCSVSGTDNNVACRWCFYQNNFNQNVTQNDCPSGVLGALPASLNQDPINSTTLIYCYHPDTALLTDTGQVVKVTDLHTGDKVLSFDESEHSVTFSPVYLWAERDPDLTVTFAVLEVTFTGGVTELKVTPQHLIYTLDPGGKVVTRQAQDVRRGAAVLVGVDDTGEVVTGEVTRTGCVESRGVYNPVTRSGTLVANGLVTSVYAADIPPVTASAAHALLWPLRQAATAPWALAGWDTWLHKIDTVRQYFVNSGIFTGRNTISH